MRLSYYANLSQCNLTTANRNGLTLSFPSILVPTLGPADPPSYLKNRCPHEHEILQDIRDTFDRVV